MITDKELKELKEYMGFIYGNRGSIQRRDEEGLLKALSHFRITGFHIMEKATE